MILQHNSSDVEEYTTGNSIKLTAISIVEKEARCYEQKNPEAKQGTSKKLPKKPGELIDYSRFVPE
jgi:hypothetical protein